VELAPVGSGWCDVMKGVITLTLSVGEHGLSIVIIVLFTLCTTDCVEFVVQLKLKEGLDGGFIVCISY
jgi:hypothetical protein